MTTTLTSHWEHIAQLLFAVLIQWLPRELATVLAMLWPMFAVLLVIVTVGLLLAWQDRRDLNRRVHRRLAQLRNERRDR
jgi:hypothetical protein